jgi:cell division protein FtsB
VSDLYGEREQKSYEGIWPSLNKFLLILILVTLTIPIAYQFIPEMDKRKVAAAQIEALNAEIDEQRMKLSHLQRTEFLLRKDPEYVATIARDGLELMAAGETIYRFEPQKASGKR